jgi:predicted DCC family thiol-disulfide oxidoreductase YuxK
VIVLYDSDCGFCRWAMAWALGRDDRHVLVPVPIQSPLGCELLVEIPPSERLRAAHAIAADGSLSSGGAAATQVLSVLAPTRALGQVAASVPSVTALLYGVIAARRTSFGRLVGSQARQRADALLAATNATTAAELSARERRGDEVDAR